MSTDVADSTSSAGSAVVADNNAPDTPAGLKKDGTASRMRLHKGNIPTVPQTKACPMCPAKFTRTTHLSRHLRTRTCLLTVCVLYTHQDFLQTPGTNYMNAM